MNQALSLSLQPGTIVGGRYVILKCLGMGSMAMVYKCQDLELGGRIVAMKALLPQVAADPTLVARFRHEIVSSYVVNHPHVVRTYDYLNSEQIVAITMDYVGGGDLADLIRQGSLTYEDIVDKLLQMCLGTQAIHEAGIVHRDLKPENILIAEDNTIKIADFSIAWTGLGTKLTKHGGVLGTLAYVSPEYLELGQLDNRSDIFSLGVLAYQMLTGETPLNGESVLDTILKRVNEDAKAAHLVRPDCPLQLSRIIQKAMQRDPSKRYQDIMEMYEDLLSCPTDPVAVEVDEADIAERGSGLVTLQDEGEVNPTAYMERPPLNTQRPRQNDDELWISQETVMLSQMLRQQSGASADSEDFWGQPNSFRTIWVGGGMFIAALFCTAAITGYSYTSAHSETTPASYAASAQKPQKTIVSRQKRQASPLELAYLLAEPQALVNTEIMSHALERSAPLPRPAIESGDTPLRLARLPASSQVENESKAAPVAVVNPSQTTSEPVAKVSQPVIKVIAEDKALPARRHKTPQTKVDTPPVKLAVVGLARDFQARAKLQSSPPQKTLATTTKIAPAVLRKAANPVFPAVKSPKRQIARKMPQDTPIAQARPTPPPSLEYRVKANLLYKFADFVEWPKGSPQSSRASLHICVIGGNPFGSYLHQVTQGVTTADNRPIILKRIASVADVNSLKGCHVAFLNTDMKQTRPLVSRSLRMANVLTVSERQGQGVIEFYLTRGRVHFRVNTREARRARLNIDPRLLDMSGVG